MDWVKNIDPVKNYIDWLNKNATEIKIKDVANKE